MKTNWDIYYLGICNAVAMKSPCLSRNIGAILVRDHIILSTGYNGPPRGVPHCGKERLFTDNCVEIKCLAERVANAGNHILSLHSTCPRQLLNYRSGTHLEICPAIHAEANAIIAAARSGTSTLYSTLYMNSSLPCKSCFGMLINAGVVEIVVTNTEPYDRYTEFIKDYSNIRVRSFNHE